MSKRVLEAIAWAVVAILLVAAVNAMAAPPTYVQGVSHANP
jgi:hypothetical protein